MEEWVLGGEVGQSRVSSRMEKVVREVVLGPMFSSKTTKAVQRAREWRRQGWRVLVLSFEGDTRYAKDALATHDGETTPCTAVASDGLHVDLLKEHDAVVLDEAQFFVGVQDFLQECDKLQLHWLVAGLDLCANRMPFGEVLDVADMKGVIKTQLTARCSVCEGVAPFTSCIVASAGVGGAESYEPRCVEHFTEPPLSQ